ncbi:YdcF family protein [Corynebacterium freneyi]|uniref:YdcF family protein n=1 Tax=Corynebacterium freneyi TaxID=134034 RepID=UPI001EF34AF9|nr:YdcF family protein [Corynebacterium freneyi]MCG7439250.1 YdcF family protein [Corynebacterium freneyi]
MVRFTTPRRRRRAARHRRAAAWVPRPVFAALAAIPGLLMAATLVVGGIVAWRDPLMRPPKLPNRRPPTWGLPAVGTAYGAATVAAAGVVARGGATPRGGAAMRGGVAARSGVEESRSHRSAHPAVVAASAVALAGLAAPGVMLPIFDVARRTWARRDTGPARTVIVLGCALRDGRPSSLLRYRLERAERVARRTPGPVTVICCGGVGEDGGPSEAEVMGDWLRDRGIADVRLEPHSTSTLENLANARPMVERGPVTVVTSDFHVFRTGSLARRAGNADWRVEGSPTPPQYWATSMLREFLALGTWWPAPGIVAGAAILGAWALGNGGKTRWPATTVITPPRKV